MEYDYSFHGIDLVQTCGACPESYKAYKDGEYAGYLRLRHGVFTVDTDVCQTVWTTHPKGDGLFEYEEREWYLENACLILSVASI